MVLPAVEPLDAVIELFEEARRRLVELFVDLAEEPAVPECQTQCAARLGRAFSVRGRFLAHLEPNVSGLTTDTLRLRSTCDKQRWAAQLSARVHRCCRRARAAAPFSTKGCNGQAIS